jgi:hypothetical protein
VAQARWIAKSRMSLISARVELIDERDVVEVMDQFAISAQVHSEDGSLRATFDFEGHKVVLDLILDGSNFAALSSYWSLEKDMRSSEILSKINRLNRRFRFVKVQWLRNDHALQLSIEFIVRGRADLGMVMAPYLKSLHYAATCAIGL